MTFSLGRSILLTAPTTAGSRFCSITTPPACTRLRIFPIVGKAKTGLGLYAEGMQELDWVVGQLLKKLDDLDIAENTLVMFTSDNGAEKFSWPDGGSTPFRGEEGLG